MTRLDPSSARHRDRFVGALIVLVGVGVLVLAVVALARAGDQPGSDVSGPAVTLPAGSSSSASDSASPSGSPTPSTSSSTATGSASSSATTSSAGVVGSQPLVVLNNTRVTDLASTVAATFTQGGWTVTDTGNLDADILSTCAYYDPDVPGAQAAAEALMAQFPKILRVKEKFGALPDGPVVVVIAADYTSN